MSKFNAAFYRWFGNSQVVDANGEPLVVYHATSRLEDGREFSVFRDVTGQGIYFADNAEAAGNFLRWSDRGSDWRQAKPGPSPRIYPVYLSIQKPVVFERFWNDFADIRDRVGYTKRLAAEGHDGIIIGEDSWLDTAPFASGVQYVVFSPTQIKSATGNRGTWDPDDPDIRHNPANPPLLIPVTKAEANWLEWASDAMWDVLSDPRGSEELYGEDLSERANELQPKVAGNTATIPNHPEVLDDLLYRLEVMAPGVSETDAGSEAQIANRCAKALTLAAKIRKAAVRG